MNWEFSPQDEISPQDENSWKLLPFLLGLPFEGYWLDSFLKKKWMQNLYFKFWSFKPIFRITNRYISASWAARNKYETSICSIFNAVLYLLLHYSLTVIFPCKFLFCLFGDFLLNLVIFGWNLWFLVVFGDFWTNLVIFDRICWFLVE